MQPVASKDRMIRASSQRKTVQFPEGLPAFEKVKEFVLISNEEEAPFLWLQALSIPDLAFVTVDPFLIDEEYQPDVCDEDIAFLGITDPEDVMLLSIVNLRHNKQGAVTANLVSPIAINWKTLVGKQVILRNHLQYSVKHQINK